MRRELSQESHYQGYEVTVDGIKYKTEKDFLGNQDICILEDSVDVLEAERLYVSVTFTTPEDYGRFVGATPSPDADCKDVLTIHSSNAIALYNSGFFDQLQTGDTITVQSSNWTYMDGNFYYIAAVSADGREYLDFETGLQNIIDEMDSNRSLL